MKTVIIVNGRPRAGKDSSIEAMTNILTGAGIPTTAFSSIDPIRNMLTKAGLDVSAKTERDRALLAEVGDAVERHSEFRSRKCVAEAARFFFVCRGEAVMFLHVREKAIIDRISEKLARSGVKVLKIAVVSERAEHVTSNAADAGVDDIGYDAVLTNNGTLDDLAFACDKLLFEQGVIEQLRLLHSH